MRSVLRGNPEVVVPYAPWILIVGGAWLFLSRFIDGHGIITGFFLLQLGACGCSLSHWRAERGLWMLASLYLLISFSIWVLFAIFGVIDAWRRAAPVGAAVLLDFIIGTAILSTTVQFLSKVARENYQLRRRDS